jgi:hypothetical protein
LDRGPWYGLLDGWVKGWLDEDGDGVPGRPWQAVDRYYAAAVDSASYELEKNSEDEKSYGGGGGGGVGVGGGGGGGLL